jgi:hypothetical protein
LPDDERRKSLNDQVKLVSSSVCARSEGIK